MIRALMPPEARVYAPRPAVVQQIGLCPSAPEQTIDLDRVVQASSLCRGHEGWAPALAIRLFDFGVIGRHVLLSGAFNSPDERQVSPRTMADEELQVTWSGGGPRGEGMATASLGPDSELLLGVCKGSRQDDGSMPSNARMIDLRDRPTGQAVLGLERDGSALIVSLEECGIGSRGGVIEYEQLATDALAHAYQIISADITPADLRQETYALR